MSLAKLPTSRAAFKVHLHKPAQTFIKDNVFKVSLRSVFKIKVYKDSLNKKEPLLENL